MSKFFASEQGHIVNALAPVDINAGVNSDVWSMKNWSHASIIVTLGVTGGASTITLEECDDFTPSNSTAIAFNYAAETTAAGDTLGDLTECASTGFATSTNNGVYYVIEVDAEQLTAAYPNLRVCFSNPSAETFGSVQVVLSGGRFQGEANATAIA